MKTPLSNIHPDLQPLAQRTPTLRLNRPILWLIRAIMSVSRAPKAPPDILVENRTITGEDGRKIRVRLYQPRTSHASTPALLWLHGGGYVMGTPEMEDGRCLAYVQELGLTVVSVAYRCAPQHPFPAALDDSYAALKWVQNHTAELNIDPARIAIGGTSAGGGLAAALAQLVHDRQEMPLVGQLLIYPMLDDRTVIRTDRAENDYVVWNQKSNRFGWEAYLAQPCGAEDVPAYAVPARREVLAGLPPAWIGVGTADLFYDEDMAYAERLQVAGVACTTTVVAGAFHGFDAMAPQLPLIQTFQQAQVAALREWFGLVTI